MDRTCPKCEKVFSKPHLLRQHLARKRSCALIVDNDELSEADKQKTFSCRYCGRAFASQNSVSRHIRDSCRIANSDEGMDMLMNHTLERQLRDLRSQVGELTDLVKKQFTGVAEVPIQSTASLAPTTTITTNNTAQQMTNIAQQNIQMTFNSVNVIPFTSEQPVLVPVEMVQAAFTENEKLREYCASGNIHLDADKSAPYILEALMEFVRRAHKDPAQRNVYMNPKRADQVLILAVPSGNGITKWEVMPLVDGVRRIFDSISKQILKINTTEAERKKMTFDVQSVSGWVPMYYLDDPDRFVTGSKKQVEAHLENLKPSQETSVVSK